MSQRYTLLELQVMHIKSLFSDVVTTTNLTPAEEYIAGIDLTVDI
jgi:hypothetical protein